MSSSSRIGTFARPWWLAATLVVFSGCTTWSPVVAQEAADIPPFERGAFAGERFPECPEAIAAAVPKCSMSIVLTQAGEYALCYCPGTRPATDEPIDPNERFVRNALIINVLKLGPATCEWVKMNGTKEKVCY